MLVEIQALVAPTSLGTPRRAVVGWDPNRLSMVLAVLEAHGGLRLGMHDVYLNVAGGLRITEPAADLAAAAASYRPCRARRCRPIRSISASWDSGAIRPVAQAQARLKEAAKLGFSKAVSPQPRKENGERVPLAAHAIGHGSGVAGERPRRGPWVSAAKGRSRSVLDIPLFEAPKG